MMTDPVADLLTRIRNALRARYRFVQVPSSGLKRKVAEILKEEGYIVGYQEVDLGKGKKVLEIELKYDAYGEPVIEGIERVSRPGRRVYAGYRDFPIVRNGMGVLILSTSQGVMSQRTALEKKLGGEILCRVW
jgi:small subunit ribosomal protein S8